MTLKFNRVCAVVKVYVHAKFMSYPAYKLFALSRNGK